MLLSLPLFALGGLALETIAWENLGWRPVAGIVYQGLVVAGLGFTVKLDKPGGFIGRDALMRQKDAGPLKKRLVMFKLKNPEPVLFHEEPVRVDGDIVGYISSGAYGFTLGASVGMGYVHHSDGVTKDLIDNGRWEIEIACERYPAEASLRAFYDPTGVRVRE